VVADKGASYGARFWWGHKGGIVPRGFPVSFRKSCRQLRLRNEAIQPSLRGWTEFILANCVMPLNKHLGDEENCEGLGGRALGGRVF